MNMQDFQMLKYIQSAKDSHPKDIPRCGLQSKKQRRFKYVSFKIKRRPLSDGRKKRKHISKSSYFPVSYTHLDVYKRQLLCVPEGYRYPLSCKIWHSSKPFLKSNGKALLATACAQKSPAHYKFGGVVFMEYCL